MKNELQKIFFSSIGSLIIFIVAFAFFGTEWKFQGQKDDILVNGINNRTHNLFAAELFEQLDRDAIFLFNSATTIEPSEKERVSLKTTLKIILNLWES